jgi:predicted ATPase
MRYILTARLEGFQRFDDTGEVELRDLTVFFGPNNSGKSAVLRAIRRMASIAIERHPTIPLPGAMSVMTGKHGLRLESGDRREGKEAASITLERAHAL